MAITRVHRGHGSPSTRPVPPSQFFSRPLYPPKLGEPRDPSRDFYAPIRADNSFAARGRGETSRQKSWIFGGRKPKINAVESSHVYIYVCTYRRERVFEKKYSKKERKMYNIVSRLISLFRFSNGIVISPKREEARKRISLVFIKEFKPFVSISKFPPLPYPLKKNTLKTGTTFIFIIV